MSCAAAIISEPRPGVLTGIYLWLRIESEYFKRLKNRNEKWMFSVVHVREAKTQ